MRTPCSLSRANRACGTMCGSTLTAKTQHSTQQSPIKAMAAGALFRAGRFGGKAIETASMLDDVDVDTDVASGEENLLEEASNVDVQQPEFGAASSSTTPPATLVTTLQLSDAFQQAQGLLALRLIHGNPSNKDLAKAVRKKNMVRSSHDGRVTNRQKASSTILGDVMSKVPIPVTSKDFRIL
eukprot:4926819-Amphidinium_carterae.1